MKSLLIVGLAMCLLGVTVAKPQLLGGSSGLVNSIQSTLSTVTGSLNQFFFVLTSALQSGNSALTLAVTQAQAAAGSAQLLGSNLLNAALTSGVTPQVVAVSSQLSAAVQTLDSVVKQVAAAGSSVPSTLISQLRSATAAVDNVVSSAASQITFSEEIAPGLLEQLLSGGVFG